MNRYLLTCLVLLVACAQSSVATTSSMATTTTAAAPSTTTVARSTTAPALTTTSRGRLPASVDLDSFLVELETTHPEPFHGISREEFVGELEALKAGIDQMTPEVALVETMKLTALLSAQGRDGHQFAIPHDGAEGPVLPFRIYEFDDGVFITAARSPDLEGARLTSIGGHGIDEVLAAVEPLVPRDGPATVRSFRSFFTLRTHVLEGLGLVSPGPITIEVERDGVTEAVTVDPIPFNQFLEWGGPGAFTFLPETGALAYRRPAGEDFWMEDLEAGGLYLRYSAVTSVGSETAEEIVERAASAEKVVLDLRHNPGGDNNTYGPLLDAMQSDMVDRPGRLFVLIDRITFSAASNLATEVEQSTEAVFVGEEMGGGLNFWDDVKFHPMPHLPVPMRIGISTRYHEKSDPADPRLTIEPDIAVAVLSQDYFSGRDPVLEAAEEASS